MAWFFEGVKKNLSGYFTQLMIFLMLLFAFRPNNWNTVSIAIWELFFTGVFFTTIFNARHPTHIRNSVFFLGVPALLLDWTSLFYPHKVVLILSLCFTIAFLFSSTASILINVVLRASVSLETLRGAICAYFLIGFAFGFLYMMLEFIHPGSFHLIEVSNDYTLHSSYLSQTLYFSFVTLLTIGFGDITPLTNQAQTFVILEGIIGQFYIAILVARIVSVYSIFSNREMLESLKADLNLPKKD